MSLRQLSRRELFVNAAASALLMPLYHRREWRSREATRAWQLQRIVRLATRAYEQVPLYRERYDAAGIRPNDVRTWEDVARLPFIDKADVADGFPDRVIARDVSLDDCLLSTSSGSSGRMLTIAHRASHNWPYALATQRLLRWCTGGSYPFWYRQAYIYTSPFPLPDQRFVYPLHFIPTATDPAPMLAELTAFRPHVLTCYPSVLRDLIAADAMVMRTLGLRGASVSSEVSSQEERDGWAEVLGCPVRDEYSSEELTRMAAQCPAGSYHLMEDITYVEVVDPDTSRPTDGVGEVVGTELHNEAMPFIRYRQGDLARIGHDACACGRPSRLLTELAGRANDGFWTSGGDWLSPGLLLDACYRTLMALPEAVAAYRLVQADIGAARLEVVPGKTWYDDAAGSLRAGLSRELQGRLNVTVERVRSLERGAAGKRATIVRLVDAPGRRQVSAQVSAQVTPPSRNPV
jgi:phenylacetate-CoA ligase